MHIFRRSAVAVIQIQRSTAGFDLNLRQLVSNAMSTHDLLRSPGADDLRRQSCAGACGRLSGAVLSRNENAGSGDTYLEHSTVLMRKSHYGSLKFFVLMIHWIYPRQLPNIENIHSYGHAGTHLSLQERRSPTIWHLFHSGKWMQSSQSCHGDL